MKLSISNSLQIVLKKNLKTLKYKNKPFARNKMLLKVCSAFVKRYKEFVDTDQISARARS